MSLKKARKLALPVATALAIGATLVLTTTQPNKSSTYTTSTPSSVTTVQPSKWDWLKQPTITNINYSDPATGCVPDERLTRLTGGSKLDEQDTRATPGLVQKVMEHFDTHQQQGHYPRGGRAVATQYTSVIPDPRPDAQNIAEYFRDAYNFAKTHPELGTLNWDLDPTPILVQSPSTEKIDPDGKIIVGFARLSDLEIEITDYQSGVKRHECHDVVQAGSVANFTYNFEEKNFDQAFVFLATRQPKAALAMPFAEYIPFALRNEYMADVQNRGVQAATLTMEALSESIALEMTKQIAEKKSIPITSSQLDSIFYGMVGLQPVYAHLPQAKEWLDNNSIQQAIRLYQIDPASYDVAILAH